MQQKENIWKRNNKYSIEQGVIKKIASFDDDLLSEEDLDNINNDNEGDDDVDESSSENEGMKIIFKIGKKRGTQVQ